MMCSLHDAAAVRVFVFVSCFKFLVCSASRGFSYVLERVCWCLTVYVLLHVALVHFVYIHKNKTSMN